MLIEILNNASGNKDPNRVNISMWGKVLLGEYPHETVNAMNNRTNKTAVELPTKKTVGTVNTNTKTTTAKNTKTTTSKNKATVKTQSQSDIIYAEREIYVRNGGTVWNVAGLLTPQSVNNPTGWFNQYNEPELYTDNNGDIVEPLLAYYSQNGNSFVATAGMVVYDNGGNPALRWEPINMSQNLKAIYYSVYINLGGYYLLLFDWDYGWYNYLFVDNDPPTTINNIQGSSEVYYDSIPPSTTTDANILVNSINGDSNNLTQNYFYYCCNTVVNGGTYVNTSSWWQNGRLYLRHRSGNGY